MHDRPRTFLFTVAILTVAAVILFIAGPDTPQVAAGPDVADGRTITVHGLGLVTVRPDQAMVELEVVGFGASAQAAQAETNAAAASVTQALRQAGIGRAQVEVTGLHLGVHGNEFRGVQVLEVEVADLGRLSDILELALAHGASANNITYGLKREAELRQQAVDRAIRDARSRAQAAADTSGVTLLSLRTLHVTDPETNGPGLAGPGQTVWRATVVATFDIR